MNCILYSTGCPKCEMLKKMLKSKNIHFQTITDVGEMLKLGFTKVPMLKINEQVLDYDEAIDFIRGVVK